MAGPVPLPSNVVQLPIAAPARLPARRINAASLDGEPIPERSWLIPGMVPDDNVTLLYGDGGTGKSLLALQIAAAVAAGTHFFGRPIAHGNVEFVTAEDGQDEMHRRLADIARHMGVPLARLGSLHMTSLADDDALLAIPEDNRGGGHLVPTPLYAELDALLGDEAPDLLVLDTLADVFGGNEIVRSQVRQFIGMLRGLALRHQCSVIVLAHPSMSGIATGAGTSGSTGWSNSVRSRLYLDRVRDDDRTEPDPDARVLRVQKSNYGRVGLEIPMRWSGGVFVPLAVTAGGDPLIAGAKAERVFLDLLAKHTLQNRCVGVAPGHTFAPKVFEAEARAQGVSKRALTDAMGRLLDSGRIQNETQGPPSRQTRRLVACDVVVPPPPA